MIENKILVIDDDKSIRWVLQKALEKEGHDVVALASADEGMARLRQEAFPLIILDIRMPGMSGLEFLKKIYKPDLPCQVIMMTAEATMKNAVEAMKWGAFDYLTKPVDMDALKITIDKAFDVLRLNDEVKTLRNEIREKFEADTVIGESPAMQEIFKTIGKIAGKDVTVLLTGESGTGKEVIARAVHYNSHRLGKPFVPVNVTAIPKELMESELFGHEKGAFTGAANLKIGKFEQASGGTLFLDEIGDLQTDLQTKLLRVLQEKEIERVGGTRAIPIDVRILAATNSNLEEKVRRGEFRDDLFFRLNVVPITIPPLRERTADVPLLLQFFIDKARHELDTQVTGFTQETLKYLLDYDWPGNVRELENLVKRAVVMASGKNLTPDSFSSLLRNKPTASNHQKKNFSLLVRNSLSEFVTRMVQAEATDMRKLIIDQVEMPLIEMVLKEVGGNQIKAAHLLGINRNTLRKKIKEFGIDPKPKKKRSP